MSNRILLFIFSFIFLSSLSFSQEKCGSYKGYLEDDIKNYPEFYKNLEKLDAELEKANKDFLKKIVREKTADGKKVIPVVVHVIYESVNSSENISESDIQNALNALNQNINGQSDKFLQTFQAQFPKTPDVFAALRGEANVEFRLARLTPSCDTCTPQPTNGIVRVKSDLTNGAEPRNLIKTLSYWNSYQYLNIWVVRNIESSDGGITLGYAQFPGQRMSTDGIVIRFSEMNDPQSTTLTHEVGHWLGLCHTWDCGGGTCGDDGVFDTPPQHTSNGFTTDPAADPATPSPSKFPWHVGLPSGIFYGCLADSLNPAGEMFMNYMDYTNDDYCTMFSKGQVDVMNTTLAGDSVEYGFRMHIWSEDNIQATGTADGFVAPTCTKNANFTDGFGNAFESICLGENIWLKSNKASVFSGNINSMTWDLSDNGSGSFISGGINDDNSLYTFSVPGTYDVSLVVSYDETTESKAYALADLDLTNAASYDSIFTTITVQGTQTELNTIGAVNITAHAIDNLGVYWGLEDSTYYRGEVEEKVYVAYYTNTCTSTTVHEDFISVMPATATNNASSYTYSFESASDLNADWVISANENETNIWAFSSFEDKSWEHATGVASHGNASVRMPAKDGSVLGSASLISASYDLSAFSNPAIKFSWSGAAANSSPLNELNVYYSNDCGEGWTLLGALSYVDVANAGLYDSPFTPRADEWNDSIMFDRNGANALKNDNIRFRLEHVTSGVSNNFYIDNILIGEESSLIQTLDQSAKLTIYPNPTTGSANIIIKNMVDKNVKIKVMDILGAEVQSLFDGNVMSKHQNIATDLSKLENGIYFISIYSEGKTVFTDKIVLFR
ncbi:MAG: zinc-dependent metalloprotease [Bacteroidota bacterium]|nr:zinc-dependent metalloprotease [Bacteroidota bacterium]